MSITIFGKMSRTEVIEKYFKDRAMTDLESIIDALPIGAEIMFRYSGWVEWQTVIKIGQVGTNSYGALIVPVRWGTGSKEMAINDSQISCQAYETLKAISPSKLDQVNIGDWNMDSTVIDIDHTGMNVSALKISIDQLNKEVKETAQHYATAKKQS